MLIPIGLDEARVNRLPWVSIAIGLACLAAFVASSVGSDTGEYLERREEALRYWAERPYLEVPAELEARFGLADEDRAQVPRALVRSEPADAGPEREELARLTAELVEAHDALPERRFGLVPARGALQPGWLTSIFMHADLFHLLGNMLIFFLLVGPFLEDVWGRPFFLAFFLAGGVLAGAAQALPMGDAETNVVGASGAISACLGAFTVRFGHRRVRIGRRALPFPAWAYALLASALGLAGLARGDDGVAHGAHVGGFVFGLCAALALRASGLERRLEPEGSTRDAATVGRRVS